MWSCGFDRLNKFLFPQPQKAQYEILVATDGIIEMVVLGGS